MRDKARRLGYLRPLLLGTTLLAPLGHAQQLQAKFGCDMTRDEDGEKVIYGTYIKELRWESTLYRPTYDFECSIDTSDDPQA